MLAALLCSRVRVEEKLLLQAYERRGVAVRRLDERALSLDLDRTERPEVLGDVGVVHDRSMAWGVACHLLEGLETLGITTVNSSEVVRRCGDKVRTSLALTRAGVRQLPTRLAFSVEEALRLLDEELGYPAVVKPAVGSWGRLVARLTDRHAAEAVLEDRDVLGNWTHRSIYLQPYLEKPGRDARVFVIDGVPLCGIWRKSEHWITNTARGAVATACDIDGEIGLLAAAAAQAVGGGALAVDLVEDQDGCPYVLEVNHTMEFRNSVEPTGVDIPGAIVDHVLGVLHERETGLPAGAVP